MRHFNILLIFLAIMLAGNVRASDDWSLSDMTGKVHTLSDYRGKWLLINFWATWCPSCVAEIPGFGKLMESHHDDLVIIGIAENYRTHQEVINFVNQKNIVYPIVLGDEDTAGDFGGIAGFPTSFLYSPSGKLVERIEGAVTQADIERRIR